MKPKDHIEHTGEHPFRRPDDSEGERVGEGELDIGAPASSPDEETTESDDVDSSTDE